MKSLARLGDSDGEPVGNAAGPVGESVGESVPVSAALSGGATGRVGGATCMPHRLGDPADRFVAPPRRRVAAPHREGRFQQSGAPCWSLGVPTTLEACTLPPTSDRG